MTTISASNRIVGRGWQTARAEAIPTSSLNDLAIQRFSDLVVAHSLNRSLAKWNRPRITRMALMKSPTGLQNEQDSDF